MRSVRNTVIAFALSSFALSAHGQWVVDQSGNGTHTNIQAAIDAAFDGDEIVVLPGTYFERVNYSGKSIRLRSSDPDDPQVVAVTVIDAEAGGSVVTIAAGEDARTTLEGFTIRKGRNDANGGGIYCSNGALPLIAHNRITACFAVLFGGGIYVASASPVIVDNIVDLDVCEGRGAGIFLDHSSSLISHNVIDGNQAGCSSGGGIHVDDGADSVRIEENRIQNNFAVFGGGITCENTSPTIERNFIVNNFGDPRAGGISCIDGNPLIANNFIAGNRAMVGGAIECNHADARLLNNTLVGNKGAEAAIILLINQSRVEITNNIIAFSPVGTAIHALTGATASIDYNCMFGNASGNFAGTATPGVGNIFLDPNIVQLGSWDDGGTPGEIEDDRWLSGDEHLVADSVCVDVGDPGFDPREGEIDIDGEPRISGNAVDIGADEVLQGDPPPSGDGDGDVDLFDAAVYFDCVTGPDGGVPTACETFDFDADDDINFGDYGAFQLAYTGP